MWKDMALLDHRLLKIRRSAFYGKKPTEAQEMRDPCMFDWQGTQTSSPALDLNAKPQIRSLMLTLRNSNIAITCTFLVCTLRNSNCAIRMIIQITHFALVWKQSKPTSSTVQTNLSLEQISVGRKHIGLQLDLTYPATSYLDRIYLLSGQDPAVYSGS